MKKLIENTIIAVCTFSAIIVLTSLEPTILKAINFINQLI